MGAISPTVLQAATLFLMERVRLVMLLKHRRCVQKAVAAVLQGHLAVMHQEVHQQAVLAPQSFPVETVEFLP